jgi:hypothetical protein
MALVLPTVVDALKIFYSLLTVALFVPVVAGLLWQRPGTAAALVSIAAGTPLTLSIHFATAGRGLYGWPPVALGLAISGASFAAVSMFGRRE